MASTLTPLPQINGTLQLAINGSMDGVIDIPPAYETYTEAYDVQASLTEDTTLNTKNKYLTDDIQIHKVGMTETSNPSGGYTLYIG